MKYVMILVLTLFSAGAWSCDIRGVPESMLQKLKVECEQMKLAAETTVTVASTMTPERISEWAQISEQFAKALGIAASEVGISVNEFMGTPAGIITTAVIIWTVLGQDFLAILGMFCITWLLVWWNKRLWFSHYERTPLVEGKWFNSGGKDVIHYLPWAKMADGGIAFSMISCAIYCLIWVVLVVNL